MTIINTDNTLQFVTNAKRSHKEKENLENNKAYIQVQLSSKQTRSIGKTLELPHELLNE